MDNLTAAVIAIAVALFIIYRLFTPRPVSVRDLVLPLGLGVFLSSQFLQGAPLNVLPFFAGSALFGLVMGLLAGLTVRVWLNPTTGSVFQRGGLPFLLAFVALLAARILAHVAFGVLDPSVSVATLNAAFIAMALGNLLGRSVTVLARAGLLNGWNFTASPVRSW